MLPRLRHLSVFVLAASATASFVACSGPGNTGRTPIPDSLVEQVPWTSGRSPLVDPSGRPHLPTEPVFPPIATGQPDPGPREAPNCSDLAGLEFSSFWFDTFEPGANASVGAGEAYAYYDDKTDGSFTAPGGINWYPLYEQRSSVIWGMPADRIAQPEFAPTCEGVANEWAMHFKGGRYNRFGAGLEHPLSIIEKPCQPEWGVCPAPAGAETDAAGFPVRQPPDSYAQQKLFLDLSSWDGISFWARRGPEGQGSMSVVLFDKHTSDALNREVDTFCRRIKPCRTECINDEECTLDASSITERNPNGTYRCFDPDEITSPGNLGLPPAELEMLFPPCGETACTSASDYLDPQFDGKECRPFTFDTHESAEFCFDEDDPDPPGSGARCGDGYSKPVTVTPEWKFYKVPFSEMRQQGFGQVSPEMDLTSVNQISFIFFVGWVDTYLDNISLYREAD